MQKMDANSMGKQEALSQIMNDNNIFDIVKNIFLLSNRLEQE